MNVDPFKLPTANEEFVLTLCDGAQLIVRRHGTPGAPVIILSHGNGLAIDGYVHFWRELSDFDTFVYDQRNHGRNRSHGAQGHSIYGFAEDMNQLLGAVAQRVDALPVFGVFHSVSSLAAVLQASRHGWPWRGLVLVDPPLAPSAGDPLRHEALAGDQFLGKWALARPHAFGDPSELAAILKATRAMRQWCDGAHEAMARALLRVVDPAIDDVAPEARWTLACARELESMIYISNAHSRVWEHLDVLAARPGQVLVLASDPERPKAHFPARIAQRLKTDFGLAVQTIEDTGHMLQIERPQQAAQIVRDFIQRLL